MVLVLAVHKTQVMNRPERSWIIEKIKKFEEKNITLFFTLEEPS